MEARVETLAVQDDKRRKFGLAAAALITAATIMWGTKSCLEEMADGWTQINYNSLPATSEIGSSLELGL